MNNKDILDKIIEVFEEKGFQVCNVTYPSGYFVFECEEYGIMHFEVKECKGWLFGCWLNECEDGKILVELFNQYKRYLDKFKPTKGTYSCSFMIEKIEDVDEYVMFDMIRACQFIKKNPYVAAMRDFQGKNYNYEKQEPVKAFVRYWWKGFLKWRTEKINDWMTGRLVKELKRVGREEFEGYDWEVHDSGEGCSPRYDLMVKLDDNDEQETGCYGLFCEDEDEEKWERKKKRIEKIGKILGSEYYFSQVSDCVIFWKECEGEEEEE